MKVPTIMPLSGREQRGVALMAVIVVAMVLFILVVALVFTLTGRRQESPALLRQARMKHLAYGAKQLLFLKMKWAVSEFYYADLARRQHPLDDEAGEAYRVFIGDTDEYQAADDLTIVLGETDSISGNTQGTTTDYPCTARVTMVKLMSQKDGKKSVQDTNMVKILVEYPLDDDEEEGARTITKEFTDYFDVNFVELF